MQRRTQEQLDGERLAGVAAWTGPRAGRTTDLPVNQYIHGILNKDPDGQFAQCMCHDPQGAQAANLVEQLITEAIGEGFIGSSFLGIVAYKNCQPQALHHVQTNATQTEHDRSRTLFDLGRVHHRAKTRGHTTADITNLVERRVIANFGQSYFRQDSVVRKC